MFGLSNWKNRAHIHHNGEVSEEQMWVRVRREIKSLVLSIYVECELLIRDPDRHAK